MLTLNQLKKISTGIHFFVGIGALAGGLAAVTNPTAPMGISTDMLKTGPFKDFLIPGLFLMLVLGVGNLIVGMLSLRNHKWWMYFSGGMGDILIMWIVIQCIILWAVAALHVIFFIVGAVQSLLALAQIFYSGQFPFQNSKRIETEVGKEENVW